MRDEMSQGKAAPRNNRSDPLQASPKISKNIVHFDGTYSDDYNKAIRARACLWNYPEHRYGHPVLTATQIHRDRIRSPDAASNYEQLPEQPLTTAGESPFLQLPRELRDQVYHRLLAIEEPQISLEYERLDGFQQSLSYIARLLLLPICQTNKQVAAEVFEIYLRYFPVYFNSGPDVLRLLFTHLPPQALSWIKRLEVAWHWPIREIKWVLEGIEVNELTPLYDFIAARTNIKSITSTLKFLARGHSYLPPSTSINHTIGSALRRYWLVIATFNLMMLLDGCLDEVNIRYQPKNTLTLLDPTVDVTAMANTAPKDWHLEDYEALHELEKELAFRG